jgi:Flp pilus assembly protein TadD
MQDRPVAVAPKSPHVSSALARAAKLERSGDLAGALAAYQAATAVAPDDPDLLASVAHLAERMELHETAARLWEAVSGLQPARLEAVDGRARVLREMGRFEDAISVLRLALTENPAEPRLWNTLGTTLVQDSQTELALTFFDEAIRLDGRSATAHYNRGGARFDLGQLEAAQTDFARARKLARRPADIAMIDFAVATLALARGDLATGWDAYEARFSRDLATAVVFEAPGRRWLPTTALAGKRLLVVAEQGLGDEMMFANVLPDVLDELGPEGRLTVAVEPRLVELFRRSFPMATVLAHATGRQRGKRHRTVPGVAAQSIDYWTPLASLNRRYRRSAADFPSRAGYLRPDPARVAHWRRWLGEGQPVVGITWRSGKLLGERRRNYPALDRWVPLLKTSGVRFINLQYGDCADELRALSELSGVEILQAPGLDVREDIDGLAALSGALDLIVGVGNATAALAGACGHPVALISGPSPWPRLGSDGYPWYPTAQVLAAHDFGEWDPVMAQAASLVSDRASSASG